MQQSLRLACFALALFSSCLRDLALPEVPAEGSVTGRVTYAPPGTTDRQPAVGAVVSLFGGASQVKTNAGGTFELTGVEKPGLLHVRFDSNSDGEVDKERVVELEGYGVGPHRKVDLGDLQLGDYASVRGRILLGNLPGPAGHGGSTFFVPEGPYQAITNDDGAFFLPNLPEGPLQFMAFRPGYRLRALGTVTLRAAEELNVGTIVLELDSSPLTPGSIRGQLVLRPAAAKGDAQVQLVSPAIAGTVADDLTFRVEGVPSGLYTLRASRSGYTSWDVRNVIVLPGTETDLGDVELTTGVVELPDAGRPDGGAPDGGPVTSDGGRCAANSECGANGWCDQGSCSAQCSASASCSQGRTCDPATSTCVRPCTLGCGAGDSCDTSTGLCRARCDVGRMCALGFTCTPQGLCVPECDVRSPMCPSRSVCVAGQCVSDRTCALDTDCRDVGEWCESGRCVARPTARVDAGLGFACSIACQCRLGEWCNRGVCESDPVPTLKLAADGGVNVRAAIADAGPDEVIALRSVDVFWSNTPFTFGGRAERSWLGGGYVECKPERWVRSDVSRSTLAVDGGMVLSVGFGIGRAIESQVVQNFILENRPPPTGQCPVQLEVDTAARTTVRFIDGRVQQNTCGSQTQVLVSVDTVPGVTVSDVTVLPSGQTLGGVLAVDVFNSMDAKVRNVRLAPQTGPLRDVGLVVLRNTTGPASISGCFLPDLVSTGTVQAIAVSSHNVGPVLVEDNVVRWPSGTSPNTFKAITVAMNQGEATVRNNLVDGSGQTGALHSTGYAIEVTGARGRITGNRVVTPASVGAAATVVGFRLQSLLDAFVAGNAISGGAVAGDLEGIAVTGPAAAGPVVVQGNTVFVSSDTVGGIVATSVPAAARLQILDNDVSVVGRGGCTNGEAHALDLSGSTGVLVERNRLAATNAPTAAGVRLFTSPDTELYANHLWAGPNTCGSAVSRSTALWATNTGPLVLGGNTLEAESSVSAPGPSEGITCDGASPISAESNVIGGGSAASHRMLATASGGGSCFDGGTWTNNHFWYRRSMPGLSTGEQLATVTSAVPGMPDLRGNFFNANVSPFDAVQPSRPDGGTLHDFRLAATSLCIDRGSLPVRSADGSLVTLDLEGAPRDAGLGPDVGCCERR